MDFDGLSICERLRDLRLRKFGPRGKAQFAKRLGIRASTYQQYETTRIPPVDLLIRAADLTQTDLLWLLVGDAALGQTSDRDEHAVIARARELLHRRPETAQSLAAFLRLIDPTGPPPAEPENRESTGRGAAPLLTSTKEMVPVVGSTAAGPARFWRELVDEEHSAETWGHEANLRLERLLEECRRAGSTDARLLRNAWDPHPDSTAALIQFSRPNEAGLLEFLSCPGLDLSPLRLVAWRIDGDSMLPRYRDGDFVLVCPDQPAADGSPCVVHQRGQIGVNCKIFKRDGADVVLIPVNEAFSQQRFPAAELLWAHGVLYSVRLKPHQVR